MTRVALVLAAGRGTRFGGNKLSALLEGEPLVVHAIRAARAAPVDRVMVVARPDLVLREWPGDPAVEVVRVDSPALSRSLQAGLAAAGEAEGLFVFLGDMPRVPHGIAAHLAEAIGSGYAALPRHAGQPGHPVLLGPAAMADLPRLSQDEGAGRLIRGRDDVAWLDWPDGGVLLDVDRPEDIERLEYR